jgi:hypothetical protein
MKKEQVLEAPSRRKTARRRRHKQGRLRGPSKKSLTQYLRVLQLMLAVVNVLQEHEAPATQWVTGAIGVLVHAITWLGS